MNFYENEDEDLLIIHSEQHLDYKNPNTFRSKSFLAFMTFVSKQIKRCRLFVPAFYLYRILITISFYTWISLDAISS